MMRRAIRFGIWITMPEWAEDALIISVRPHGESSALVNLLTAGQGRHAGLVRGGASSRLRGTLQPGNRVSAQWRARLPEQLGTLQVELVKSVPALFLDDPLRLAGVASACALLEGCLPEREAQPELFAASEALFDLVCIDDPGFSLNLASCAVTGQSARLAHVSPKSGRAVGENAAGEYAGRMLALPRFLGGVACNRHDYDAGMELTGHFLERRVFAAHHADLPPQRRRLSDMVTGIYGGLTV
jgi:DNA repair protein RecO (recombination protein O)